MPVAAPLAIGAATIGGAAISASAAKKAAKTAANSNAESNALQQQIYQQNSANLSPFMQRGNVAGDSINALLGLPTYQAPPPPANTNAPTGNINPFVRGAMGFTGFQLPQQSAPTPQPVGMVQSSVTPGSAQNAFRSYIDNSDYGFRESEGNRGLNSGYAARGLLESGAAMKALERFKQNLQSGYRNEYMGMLGQQQQAGLSGANALAGVGTNYANNVGANNAAAASVAANASLARGNALASGLGTATNALGNAFGSSYGGQSYQSLGLPGYGLPGGAALPTQIVSPWS